MALSISSNLFFFFSHINHVIFNFSLYNLSISSFLQLFARTLNFNGNVSNWDTSSVHNMDQMFYDNHEFEGTGLSAWDTSSATSMYHMFDYDAKFNADLGDWDVSKVTTMKRTFGYNDIFNQSLSDWDVSSVTNMEGLFFGNYAYDQPLNNWDMSKVETIKQIHQV